MRRRVGAGSGGPTCGCSNGVPRWLAPLAVLGCIGGAVGYTLISNPTDSAPDAPPTCVLKLTTGLDCPGCGGTRAAWYLLHGDLAAAARHHLLFVFAVPFIIYLYIAWAAQRALRPQAAAAEDPAGGDRHLHGRLARLLDHAQPALGALQLVLRLGAITAASAADRIEAYGM